MNKTKSIKTRIMLIYVSLIFVLGVLSVMSVYFLNTIKTSATDLVSTNYTSIIRAKEMEGLLKELKASAQMFLLEDEKQTYNDKFSKDYYEFEKIYKEEYYAANTNEEAKQLLEIITEYTRFGESIVVYRDRILSGQYTNEEMMDYYTENVNPFQQKTEELLKVLIDSTEATLYGRGSGISSVINRTIAVMLTMYFLTACILMSTFKNHVSRLFRPIYDITERLKGVGANGGVCHEKEPLCMVAQEDAPDEIRLLCSEFNHMTSRLEEFEKGTIGSLMEERNKTVSIVRGITDPIIILDADYSITLLNSAAEELLETKLENSLGRHFAEFITENSLSECLSNIDYKTKEFKESIIETKYGWKPKYYKTMVSPSLNHEDNEQNFIVIVFNDITEMKFIENTRSNFIATISHEFKTPLTSIIMGADLLKDEQIGFVNQQQKEIIDTIKEDGQNLSFLVDDLLVVSKVEYPDFFYNFDSVSMEDVIDSSIKHFMSRVKSKKITFIKDIKGSILDVRGDFPKLEWLLNNLLSNAIKFTDGGGIIKVSAETIEEQNVLVCVEDNGLGIPKDYLEKIFNKYVQVPECDIEVKGTGIGLALARSITLAHKGEIWCESEGAGGSKFYFTIPVWNTDKRM